MKFAVLISGTMPCRMAAMLKGYCCDSWLLQAKSVFCLLGPPDIIHTDNGKELNGGDFLAELSKMLPETQASLGF